MKRRLLAILLALSMLFTLVPPNIAMAVEDPVAKIGDTDYDTLDAAIAAVKDGESIVLLKDGTINKNPDKDLTFEGTGKISVTGNAWWPYKNILTLKGSGVTFDWNGDTGAWLMMSLSGKINVDNGATFQMRFDSKATAVRTAIYMNDGSEINVDNGSHFAIYGSNTAGAKPEGQGIQLAVTAKSSINVKNGSTFLIEGTNRGYVNSPNVTVEDSTFTVQNCTSNASNGGKHVFINSDVKYLNNAGHGLSTESLTVENSTILANKNRYFGITSSGDVLFDKTSVVTANENGYGYTGAGIRFANDNSKIESGAKVTIDNNLHNGLENYGTAIFENGSVLEIMGNNEPKKGGGVYNGSTGNLTLPFDAKIYNNHAGVAGDDLYSTGAIQFGAVGSDWQLDNSENKYHPGTINCGDKIDGWYQDGSAKKNASEKEKVRWNAHNKPIRTDEFTDFAENNLATVNGPLALKAAHGLIPQVVENNKSKEATNLDGNYESEITLTLPHEETPAPNPVEPRVAPKAASSENEFAAIGIGSKVVDYMGYDVEDDYDFDFINDAERLSVSVNGETYPAVKIDDNVYGFKESTEEIPGPLSIANSEDGTSDSPITRYEYYLEYFPEKNGEEHFVWEINTVVNPSQVVQLHYAVKLTNRKSEPGTYGEYDQYGQYGENPKKSLYTNNSAILYPKDTEGLDGVPEIYKKPTVSYTVSKPTPPTPDPKPTPIDPAGPEDLNTVDHYSYIIGYPDGLVRPQGKVTRAEVATIFFRMLTDEARTEGWSQTNNFSDVAAKDWYSNAISTLSNMGIIAGYEDGTFRPNAPITRAEYAKIAVSFFKENVKDYQGTFSDVAEGQWYTQYVETAAALGLISGYPDGTFAPNKTITRAEACTITNSTLNRKPCKDHLLPVEEMVNWPDNQPDAWYYYEMQEATNSHDYEWDGETENWTKKLSQRDWVQLEKEWSEANSATGGGEVKNENK